MSKYEKENKERMMKMKQRWMKSIAVVLLMAIILPMLTFITPITVEAATTPPNFTEAEIKKKLDTLCAKLDGKYFTSDQKAAGGNDTESSLTNIVAASWFKSMFGNYSISNMPKQYASDGSSLGGYSCFGFATFAEYYLYSSKNTDNLVGEKVFQGAATKSNILKYARVGDILRFGPLDDGHSVILISVNSNDSIKVLDCNWGNSCKVSVGNRSISTLASYGKMVITRADNYSNNVDTTAPMVSNVKITDADSTGFTISCTATDDVGVNRVQFPVWTTQNGKDDQDLKWWSNTACKGTQNGSTWTFRVNTSRHNNELGEYYIMIYAYDDAGNYDPVTVFQSLGKTYTVRYDANGGTGAPNSQIKKEGVELTLSSQIPSREGYSFDGWRGDVLLESGEWTTKTPLNATYQTGYQYYTYGSESNGNPTNWYSANRADIVEKAGESAVKYFELISTTDHGDNYTVNGQTVDYTTMSGKTGSATVTNTIFTKGVTMYRQNGPVVTDFMAGSVYKNDGNITLYAQWNPNEYTVSFNANGGQNVPAIQTKYHDVDLKLNSMEPTRNGYEFVGWSTNADATDATYQPGEMFDLNQNTTLYAVWSKTAYVIKYNANGGEDAPASQSKEYGIDVQLSSEEPIREGYTFKGWSTSANATVATYQPGEMFDLNQSITLYAVWSHDVHTVIFIDWDGTTISEEKYHLFEEIRVPADPVRNPESGYVYEFAGWDRPISVCKGNTLYTACYNKIENLNGWILKDGEWYYYKNNIMQTGWQLVNGYWYYMEANGVMVTGDVVIDGALSHFNSGGVWEGYAKTGWRLTEGKWQYIGNGGKLAIGWKQVGGVWYYFDESGIMQTGWQKINGIWYYMNSSGGRVTGWRFIGGVYYYFNTAGAMQTGWLLQGNTWYYLNSSGAMVTGDVIIDGAMSTFESSGAWKGYSNPGWKQVSGKWYYLGNGGKVTTGWKLLGSTWYYFDKTGVMQTGWQEIGGVWYYLYNSGAMAVGTVKLGSTTYRFSSSGAWLGS